MTGQVRLVSVVMQLELVVDDGNTLTPLETAPIRLPPAGWPPNMDALLEQVQRQIDGEDQPI